jgi:DNA-directed RNA polymerase specialized sigma subunit
MRPLLKGFRGMIRSHANQYSGNVEIPPAAINAEFTRHAVRAIQTYDPNRGAALGTWVGNNLVKGKRWISQHMNTARISEGRVYKVGDFQNTRQRLDQKFGRPPSTHEMAEHLGWSPKEVERLEKEIRSDLIGSDMTVDPYEIMPSKAKEILSFLPYELSGQEKTVYEYTLGTGGKPKLNGNQIAQKMGVSPSTVSRIKNSIAKKAKKLMV